jgi:hypothetical protein
MGIRETINQRPWISMAVVGVIVVFALVLVASTFRGGVVAGRDQAYFSDDDGKTYFADDASQIPPFDHNGKTAYLAGVFQCEGVEPFVAYLIRYTPEGKAELERFSAAARNSSDAKVNVIKLRTRQIKAPREGRWTPSDSMEFDVYLSPARPKGATGHPTPLFPGK